MNEDIKRQWKRRILQSERISYRVYYIDYGTDSISYYTDRIYTLPEAQNVLEAKIANGVDVAAMIVEEQTILEELFSNA